MKLFDSLSKDKVLLDQDEVKIYACGPTVYNLIHIGNARPLVVTDVIVRYLKSKNVNVNFLMNVTDVDDKIINEAIKNNMSDIALAKKYEEHFIKNLSDLNVLMPTELISISNKMNEIVEFINILESTGQAYEADGSVYFNVEKNISEYGKVSHQKIDELKNGVRIENDQQKKSPLDFALWKKTEVGRQFISKWSSGRPGWHTECVTLIDNYFGETISLHIGGTDLRFPHHENERIQYYAKNKTELSKIWFHVGHILLENQKMSKSIGNIITVDSFLEKNSNNDLRYIMLASKYSQPVNVTDNLISQAKKWNDRNENLLRKINWMSAIKDISISNDDPIDDDLNKINFSELFNSEMENDLNTSGAITIVDQAVKYLNSKIKSGKIDKSILMLKNILSTMGFEYYVPELSSDDIEKVKTWKELISKKQYDDADAIRSELEKNFII